MAKGVRIWENLKRKLIRVSGDLEHISCSFFFHDFQGGCDKRLWQDFKQAFGIKAEIPDYLQTATELYEVGKGQIRGMRIEAFGPSRKNPAYVPLSEEEQERERRESFIRSPGIGIMLGKLLTHPEIVKVDREKAIALCQFHGYNWDNIYGLLLELYGKGG